MSKNMEGSSVGSYLAFPMITTGIGAVKTIARNGGFSGLGQNALAVEEFKQLKAVLQDQPKLDIFSRGRALAENYDAYKSTFTQAKKLEKLAKKAESGSLGAGNGFKNIFRRKANKITIENVGQKYAEAQSRLEASKDALSNGKSLVDVAAGGFKGNFKSLLKTELKNPIAIAFSAIPFAIETVKTTIPTFKNEGVGAGLKQLGKSFVKAASDFVSYAAGGALGRVIGWGIGALIPGAGVATSICASLCSSIGAMFVGNKVSKFVGKIFKTDKNEQQAQELAQAQQQYAMMQEQEARAQQYAQMPHVQAPYAQMQPQYAQMPYAPIQPQYAQMQMPYMQYPQMQPQVNFQGRQQLAALNTMEQQRKAQMHEQVKNQLKNSRSFNA